MGFVKEEDQFGFFGVAHFGQVFEEFGQKPEQKRCVKAWCAHQLVGGQDVDLSLTVCIGAHQVAQVQRGFAKEFRATLVFKDQQPSLDGPDRLDRDVPIAQGHAFPVFPQPDQHGLQVLEIKQRQAFFIGHAKRDVEDPLLRFGQFKQPRDQQRPHFRNRGADRMALGAEKIPEGDRKGRVGIVVKADGAGAVAERLMQFEVRAARFCQS